MVGAAAAGQHRVQLLPGLLTGHQAVHGVGGDPLGGVDGGGVSEFGGGLDIAGGQGDGAAVPEVPHPQAAVPVRLGWSTGRRSSPSRWRCRSLRSLLRVMIRSPTLARFPSANSTSRLGVCAGEAVGAGALVELG